jgi:hypothetical protein
MNTLELCERLKQNQQIIFVKYGDGEISCMIGVQGCNCDNDSYTPNLRIGLIKSFLFFFGHPNAYIGKWEAPGKEFLQFILENYVGGQQPKWVDYHFVMNDDKAFSNPNMYTFLETVQMLPRKKILLTNAENYRMLHLFKAQAHIVVPPNNWFQEFEKYAELIERELTDNCVLFTAAGQGSKVMIAYLTSKYPTISCIDIGSSFDFLCQKKKSRAWNHTYEDQYNYYKNLLPEGW